MKNFSICIEIYNGMTNVSSGMRYICVVDKGVSESFAVYKMWCLAFVNNLSPDSVTEMVDQHLQKKGTHQFSPEEAGMWKWTAHNWIQ
ncbi:hypothetical protein T4D_10635 [Trichinella pseudospiralis]|uniref:Uncharacterized protein n=1 Tax=Trichinella pseudospiralis TaxID=6337 RepID=A0A0V1FZM3_TRIPS|nr:hypothetical protein T4D_10635 [Trichinella pseudospiralis]